MAVSSPARELLSRGRDSQAVVVRRAAPGRQRAHWIAAGILLAAFALRLYRLAAPSLGYDESFNLLVAGSSLAALPDLLTSQEPYPPLHFALLHAWTALAGHTEFAARFWALLAGVLLIALLNRLATLLLGTVAGLLVAALAAFSPAYLWYSQEIKMYPLLATLVAASLLAFARLALSQLGTGDRPRDPVDVRWTWVVYVLTTAAALYVHYTAVLIVALEVVVAWALGIRSGRRALAGWLAAQAGVLALFLPWAWLARRLLGGYQSDAPAAGLPLATLRTLWQVFGVGYSDELQHRLSGESWVALGSAALLGLAILGLLVGRPGAGGKTGFARWLTLATFVVPLGFFVLLATWRPVFAARHATVISVGYYLVLGGGLARLLSFPTGRPPWRGLGRGVAVAGLGGLAVLWSIALIDYFADPAYTRTDNRAVAEYVRAHAGPNDLLIFNAPYFAPAVLYYQPGPLATMGLPAGRPVDQAETAARLRELAQAHPRIWLALWQDYFSDPDQFVERWLNRNAARQVEKRFASIRLVEYATADQPLTGARPAIPLAAEFGERLRLIGYTVTRNAPDALEVDLFWQASRSLDTSYTVFVHALDPAGRRVGQWDQQPKSGLAPTHQWLPGEVILDRYRLTLEAGAQPDHLQVGLYEAGTQARLPLTAGAPAGSTSLRLPLTDE